MVAEIEPILEKTLESFNVDSLGNLFSTLKRCYTKRNLLVLDRNLTSLINFLTPFLKVREAAKAEKTILLDSSFDVTALENIDGVIVIFQESDTIIDQLNQVVENSERKKLYFIGKSVGKSFIYRLNKFFGGPLTFEGIISSPENEIFRMSPKFTLLNWLVQPLVVDLSSRIISLEFRNSDLSGYYVQPMEQLDLLSNTFIKLLASSSSTSIPALKIKNIYGKGDNSASLINVLRESRLPEFLSNTLTPIEQQFYEKDAQGNVDLIVLERSLDYAPVFLSQITYQGLLDDLFGIDIDSIKINDERITLNDGLYGELKHLNFASIGEKLKNMAKVLQSEYLKKDHIQDLAEIKKLVSGLGDLTSKQEMIKKHTDLSEVVLNKIKFGTIDGEPTLQESKYNEYERFLTLENEIFDMEYKKQLSVLKDFLNEQFSRRLILSLIVLISIMNDGIKERDLDWIYQSFFDSYGLESALIIEKMIEHNIITVSEDTDLLYGALSFFNPEKPEVSSTNEDGDKKIGTSGSNLAKYKLIDKFWNLHPESEVPVEGDGQLLSQYSSNSFTLPSNTVPMLVRLVEALYVRDFLQYKPVNNVSKRPNWEKLGVDRMFQGKSLDINVCDILDSRGRNNHASNNVEYIVVILIGGITRSEISCLRYLEERLKKLNLHKEIIIITPGIITSLKFIDSISRL